MLCAMWCYGVIFCSTSFEYHMNGSSTVPLPSACCRSQGRLRRNAQLCTPLGILQKWPAVHTFWAIDMYYITYQIYTVWILWLWFRIQTIHVIFDHKSLLESFYITHQSSKEKNFSSNKLQVHSMPFLSISSRIQHSTGWDIQLNKWFMDPYRFPRLRHLWLWLWEREGLVCHMLTSCHSTIQRNGEEKQQVAKNHKNH